MDLTGSCCLIGLCDITISSFNAYICKNLLVMLSLGLSLILCCTTTKSANFFIHGTNHVTWGDAS